MCVISAPTHALEEGRDLGGGAIGIFAMGKVSDARKEREVEIAETRAKPVGPVVRKQRIVLWPPQASRHRDRRKEAKPPARLPGFRKLSVKASITSSNAALRCDQWRLSSGR
jgi:hypothetical protein